MVGVVVFPVWPNPADLTDVEEGVEVRQNRYLGRLFSRQHALDCSVTVVICRGRLLWARQAPVERVTSTGEEVILYLVEG